MREVGLAVIEARRGLVFEHRPAGHALLPKSELGCFLAEAAGQNENARDALIAALKEQTGIEFDYMQLQHLGKVSIFGIEVADGEVDDIRVSAFLIVLKAKQSEKISANITKVIPADKVSAFMHEFDEPTRAVFEEIYT